MRSISKARAASGRGTPKNSRQTRLIGLLLVIGCVLPSWAGAAELVYSRLADRSNSVALSGATLSGLIYVSVSGAPGSGAVDFYVDDPDRSGAPARADNSKPFDLMGGSRHSAQSWDLATLSPGFHTVTAVINTKRKSNTVHASFNVAAPAPANVPPSIQSISAKSTAEGEFLSFMVVASDPDGVAPSLQAAQLPAGAVFSPGADGTGEFRWTPDYLAAGNYTIIFQATDAVDANLTDSVSVSIAVSDTNRPPSLTPVGPQNVEAGQFLSVSISGSDPDGTIPVLAASSLPPGALLSDFGNGTGRLEWSPGDGSVGDHTVHLTAIDASDPNLVDASDLTITVTAAPNLPPSIQSISSKTVGEGQTLTFTISADDPDNGPPTLSASNIPPGATFTPLGGGSAEFSWTPGYDSAGTYTVSFSATDAADPTLIASIDVGISITDTNRPPSLAPVGPQSVGAGQFLSVSVSGSDPDGTIPVLAGSSLPPGALLSDFGNGTGRLEWSPGDSNVGDHIVRLSAIDADDPNLVDASELTITVTAAPNLPPSIQSISSKTVGEGQTLTFTISADDPDNGPPTLSVSNIPPGATFTPLGGGSAEFSWTPGYDSAGTYTVSFSATDAADPTLIASIDVGISITDTNRPPSLAPVGPQSVEAGQFLSVSVSGSDPDGTIPVLAASSLPPGALLTDYGNGTGRLEWSPGDGSVGYHTVHLTAIDADDPNLVDASELIITVTAAPNLPPSIQSISSKTTAEGQMLAFTVNADDPDSGPPTLSVSNIPPGATFTPLGGGSAEFSWMPGYDSAGTYTVSFSATDAADPTLIASIDVGISITDTNRPPSLAPVGPQSVEAGQFLSVSVSGSDPDGTIPVLSASSLPPGALLTDYGNGTGRLEWSPGDGSVGDHTVHLTAIDADDPNLVDASELTITVTAAPNLPPSIQSVSSKTTAEGQMLAFTVNADDPDNGPPTLSASNIPPGATFTPLGGGSAEFSWMPGYDSAGTYTVSFSATDAADPTLIASIDVGISITDTNRPPSLAPVGPQSVEAGQFLSVSVSGSDPDGTIPVLSASSLPPGALLTDYGNGTGRLEWSPGDGSVGDHTVHLTAIDADDPNLVDASELTITVTAAPNLPPSIQSISSKTTAEGQTLTFTISADDPDNGPPTLSVSNIPPGATFTPLGGGSAEFSWMPGYDASGTYAVTFTATDAEAPTLIASINVGISVDDTNRPPSVAPINAQSVEAGQTLSVNVSATDPDGTPPALSIQGLPTGAMFTDNGNGTGTMVWGVADTDVGNHSLGVVAQDAADATLSDSQQILISVTEAPEQPLAPVTVVWDPHPQTILGYKVFYGPSEEAAILQISELRFDAGDVNAADPSVTYDPETDLGLQAGDPACFRVSAFDEMIESPLSQAACM